MSVQRWTPIVEQATDDPMSLKYMYPHSSGQYVTYADHVAALAEAQVGAEILGIIAGVTEMAAIRPSAESWREAVDKAYQNGRAEALREAREAVAAAKPHDFPYIERDDYSTAWEYAQDCMGAAVDALAARQAPGGQR